MLALKYTSINIMNIVIWTTSIMIFTKMVVRAYEIRSVPRYNLRQRSVIYMVPVPNLAFYLQPSGFQKQCFINNIKTECPVYQPDSSRSLITRTESNLQSVALEQQHHENSLNPGVGTTTQVTSYPRPGFRRAINHMSGLNLNLLPSSGKLDAERNGKDPQNTGPMLNGITPTTNGLNLELDSSSSNHNNLPFLINSSHRDSLNFPIPTAPMDLHNETGEMTIFEKFSRSLDIFERKFYMTTFTKLTSISPVSRRVNGMSYVQSGLFLQLSLMALSTEVDIETRRDIDECLGLHVSVQETIQLINETVSSLPVSSDDLKFRWSSRLVLGSQNISDEFLTNVAPALQLHVDRFNGTETPKEMSLKLNRMVEVDSGGAIHSTFEEDDLSEGIRSVLITTLYLRARWRSAPTLLNGTRPFRDSETAGKTIRMIRVNDVMRYADLAELDAEALEIPYSTPGLSLLLLVPRGNSLRRLADETLNTNLGDITERMQSVRVAATLPLYTLRMTLLLPNKLEAMNISRLVDTGSEPQGGAFRLSRAVQRVMFWAEAGRNAFKDDGIEWDATPQRELVVDRPYIFYVRWKNKTLMNGNFVL